MSVIVIEKDTEFQTKLSSSKNVVVVKFSAAWCGPCKRIAPFFEQMATKYPQSVFLKVDINVCQETALAQGISSMPTFVFYKGGEKIDSITGSNTKLLEDKLKEHCSSEGSGEAESPVKGHIDLYPFILKAESGALNEADKHPLANCLQDDDKYLQSDCDNQLIIPITFSQAVKIHSIMIKAPDKAGPKTVKLFINQPTTLDFDGASKNEPTQSLDIDPNDLTSGKPIGLQFVKFQNVQNVQIFIQNNHDNSDVTRIDCLTLFGSPIATTDMNKFERVAGKKGETDH
ncbi:Thioredoxin-like protein 1 [Homalodisca vitripennis]|nr:Thioredoxin-like protein 1 [Homalodisca vitripennis]